MHSILRQKWFYRTALGGIVVVLLVSSVFFPAPSNNRKQTLRIAICTYKINDTFISTIVNEFDRIAQEYEQQTGIKVYLDYADGKESQRTQNEQVSRYIALGYDAICVNIVDRTNAAPMIDEAIDADIPLIFFNREPVAKDIFRGDKIYYVGSVAKETAIMQGQLILDAYRKNKQAIDRNNNGVIEYYMLEGEMGHQDTIIRTETSLQTLLDAGVRLEPLQDGIANWSRSQAAALVEKWLSPPNHKIPELIICNNDDMALGAADALDRMGIQGVAVVGIDATPSGKQAVQDGRLLGSIDCNPRMHASCIFKLASELVLHGKPPADIVLEDERYVWVDLKKVTRESTGE